MSSNKPAGLVSWIPITAVFETFKRAGTPDSAYTRQTHEAVRRARETREFLRWETYLDLIEQARCYWGDDERFRRACEAFDDSVTEVSAFVQPGMPVIKFCRYVIEGYDAASYPDLRFDFRELPDGRAELEVWLPPEYRDATAWFIATEGAMRTITRHLRLPPTKVEVEFDAHHAIYTLEFPALTVPRTPEVGGGADDVMRLVSILRDDVRRAIHSPIQPSPQQRLESLAAGWSLTKRQREVLDCLCRGLANKEIAAELQCALRTVELHVTDILRKAGADSRNQLVARLAHGN
jgi:DNA-binding CsgD family transcriptional regulator